MALKPLVYNATLAERRDHTNELTSFLVRHDEPLAGDTPFVPGQYVALGLNNEQVPELGSVRRSMSIASAPEQTGAIEFYVRYVRKPESENPLTHLLWKLAPGQRLFMTRKPVGKFTLVDTCGVDDPRFKIFVAAGTGLAPFVSILRSMKLRDQNSDMSRFVLLHGASYPDDLCYGDELASYATENRLHYMRTISRPKEATAWKGDVGRVEDYFLPDRLHDLERRIGVTPGHLRASTACVLICGLQGTIGESIIRLLPRGLVPDHRRIRTALEVPEDAASSIWWEQYDTTPVIDVEDATLMTRLRAELRAQFGK
jgi:ferredoxin--NADP+ reductase